MVYRMMRAPKLLPIVLLLLVPTFACADLESDVKAILHDKYLNKSEVGISIARLGADADATEIVYKLDSDVPLIPASNLKLLTTSAFLDKLGPDFKFRTALLINKSGDVYIVGDGDPTLGDAELLRKSGWTATTTFKQWAEELKKRGVTSVRNVLVDDSVFDEVFIPKNWKPSYASARYSAQIGGVNLNANCVDFLIRRTQQGQPVEYTTEPPTKYVAVRNTCLTGTRNAVSLGRRIGTNEIILSGETDADSYEPISVTIHDPPLFAAAVLAETLAGNGVAVTGAAGRDRTAREKFAADSTSWALVAALETKLSTVLERANKDSMNLYAECLCKRLGHAVSGQPGSWENGTAAVADFLKRIGVAEDQFHLEDGCGLARQNNVSADALVKVLAHNFHSPHREFFMNSLAVGGTDGTFKGRFKGFGNRVLGKSGYVSGVSALSGYVKAKDEQWYVFSILMNKLPEGTNPTAKQIQERIIAAVDANAEKR